MKTVYEPIKTLLIFGSVFFIAVVVGVTDPTTHTLKGLLVISISSFFFILTLIRYFYPEWAYGENGFELLRGAGKGTYPWNEVQSIGWQSGRYGGRPFLLMKKGRSIYMSYLMTRNYLETLRFVVESVQRNNSKTEISPIVLKKVKG